MATRSNHAPGEKRGEERRRKKEKKDGRLAPFGIVAHQSTSGIRTLSGLAVLREGLTAMQTTATDDGDERRRYNEWLLGGELDGDAEDDDERSQRTTATSDGNERRRRTTVTNNGDEQRRYGESLLVRDATASRTSTLFVTPSLPPCLVANLDPSEWCAVGETPRPWSPGRPARSLFLCDGADNCHLGWLHCSPGRSCPLEPRRGS